MAKKRITVDGVEYEEVKGKRKAIVNIVIDKSGSMESVRDATISGLNEYLKTLKEKQDKLDLSVNIVMFDTEVEKAYTSAKLKEVKQFDRNSYVPNGMTALYDAVCAAVKDTEKEAAEDTPVFMVIMTDGEENSSREYTQEQMKEMVERLTKQGNWTFVYLGANQDAWANAAKWGISHSNTVTFNSTGLGMRSVFTATAQNMGATMDAYSKGEMSTASFFSKEQQDEIEATK